MSTLEKAIALAATAHTGQRDKEGLNYILHPIRVMLRLDNEPAQIVGVLHDTIEDTNVTEEDLRREGFSDDILAALRCVTHAKDEPYADYVVRCSRNPIARQVKLADLADNTRLERSIVRADRLDRDLARIHRYHLSYKFLTGQMSEADYRTAMQRYG